MHQNALQMLQIVKATFPTVSFDNKPSNLITCTDLKSDGLTLSCLWTMAVSMLDGEKTSDDTEILHALTRVSTWLEGSFSIQQLMHI